VRGNLAAGFIPLAMQELRQSRPVAKVIAAGDVEMTIFVIHLRPMPSCADPIRALRGALKTLGRKYQLKAISAVEETDSEIPAQQESRRADPAPWGPKEPQRHDY
jgi:hypothetical protein